MGAPCFGSSWDSTHHHHYRGGGASQGSWRAGLVALAIIGLIWLLVSVGTSPADDSPGAPTPPAYTSPT